MIATDETTTLADVRVSAGLANDSRRLVVGGSIGGATLNFSLLALVSRTAQSAWEEKHPEVLIHFGEPLLVDDAQAAMPAGELNRQLEARLETARHRLARASISRDATAFQTLVGGRTGTNPVYDAWRWLKARWRSETFHPAHGTK